MNYSQLEAYENGHFSGSLISTAPLPLWARALNCEHGGLWIYAPVAHFLKQCRHMECISQLEGNMCMEVVEFGADQQHYPFFLKRLENLGLNMLPYAGSVTLECFGASFNTTVKGLSSLAGLFKLCLKMEDSEHVHHYQFQGELRFPRHPNNYIPISRTMAVGHFIVQVVPTMDPLAARGGVLIDEGFSEQFSGFFERSITHEPAENQSRKWSFWKQRS